MKKLICSMLAAIVFLLSPLSAFASTTESMMMYSTGTRSIPSGFNIPLAAVVYNKDTNQFNISSNINVQDNSLSSFSSDRIHFSGFSSDYLIGFRTGFSPSIRGGFYSEHILDLCRLDFRFNYVYNGNNRLFNLTSYAIPDTAYAIYTGVYDYQIYDGDVNYDRWVYDNPFTITKPISVSFGKNDVADGINFRGNVSIAVPSLSVADLLDVTAYRNDILSNTSFDNNAIDEFSYERVRISCDTVTVYVLYSIDDTNFAPYNHEETFRVYDVIDDAYAQIYLRGSETEPTLVNIRSVDYLDNTSFSLKNIANGINLMVKNISSSMSNVVTNATDNANRIIQNTTQKVDEVKQGVTEVKNSVIETKNSILDLPNKIKDMLLGLIVPSSDTMANKYSEFSQLLEQKLGIIYQIPMMLFDFFDTIVNAATSPQTSLTLPAFKLPWIDGTTLTVWEPIEYDIIPEGMEVLSDLIKTVTSMTVVVLTFNSVKRAYERFLRS